MEAGKSGVIKVYSLEEGEAKDIRNQLQNLIKQSEENGFWTIQSGIIRENTASIATHKNCGFREIGIREKVAKMKNGIWHDVVLMERRSKIVGIG